MFKVVAPDTGTLTVQTNTSNYIGTGADTFVRVFDVDLNQIASNDDISVTDTDSFVTVPVVKATL